MNDSVADAQRQPALEATPGKSAGRLLREAREAAGLHIGALAVSLKVPVKKLEALEADDLAQLPDAVFARALAATVCRSLKVDPQPVLARLPQLRTPPLQVGSQVTPVRLDSLGGGMHMPSFGGLPRSVVYLSAMLLIGAVIVSLLPSFQIGADPAVVDSPDGVAIRLVPNLVTPGSTEVSVSGASPGLAEAGVAAKSPASASPTAEPAAAPVSALTIAAEAKAATTATGGAIAVFTTREPSWVQVVDAAGLVHLRKTMDRGESVSINGTLPLTVVVGRATAIELVVRGKPFDLQAVAKDNVARFQIK